MQEQECNFQTNTFELQTSVFKPPKNGKIIALICCHNSLHDYMHVHVGWKTQTRPLAFVLQYSNHAVI